MARLLFECEDREGHRVFFETSEKDAKELAATYEASKQWLIDNGFTLVSGATPVKAETPRSKAKPKVRFDGVHCPQCQGALWDNRAQKQSDPSRSKWPDFSCKDKEGCRWAVWPGQYEIANGAI
ncbi:MAG: hypothetical protein ACOX2R_00850 [Anaerolineae bacterium]|jgi:hypothetical protein